MAALLAILPAILKIVSIVSAVIGLIDARQAVENSMAVGAVDLPSVMGVLPSWALAGLSFAASFIKFNGGASTTLSGLSSVLPLIESVFSGAAFAKDFKLTPTTITIPTEDHLVTVTVKVDPRPVPATVPSGFKLVPVDPDGPPIVL